MFAEHSSTIRTQSRTNEEPRPPNARTQLGQESVSPDDVSVGMDNNYFDPGDGDGEDNYFDHGEGDGPDQSP